MAPQGHHQLHFILFPFMAQGHTIPILDIARLFAQRGVIVTIVTTPLNYLRFKSVTDRAIRNGLPIRILQLYFPSIEAGLPEGCENIDTVPSRNMAGNFFKATSMLQQQFEQTVGDMEPVPSCIISDFFLHWTSETAHKFNMPRIIFHGTNCFSLFCTRNLIHSKAHEKIKSESEPFTIPGLPDHIVISKTCLPAEFNKSSRDVGDEHDKMNESELTSHGVLINSFYDLEPAYIKEYKKAKQNKVWCIGPVSLYNKDVLEKVERGNKASIDENQCMNWLDMKLPNSVIYVCLGSLCKLIPAQLKEIGLGLEASKCSFIWVINGGERYKELDKWLDEEGFECRTKDRGLVIRSWAPQVLILSHQAIGGFLTHCGWNSAMEGVCAGIPMITWPMFAEQFLNEKLIVQILGIGVAVGVRNSVSWGDEDDVIVLVTKEEVEQVVRKLMRDDDEGVERKHKAKELAILARNAMEVRGTSQLDLTLFIEDIKHQVSKRKSVEEDHDVASK